MAKVLTDLAIKALKPGTKRREIGDARIEGLVLVIEPSGTRRWSFRYRYAKRQRRIAIGSWPAVDLLKARARAEQAVRALERGMDPTVSVFGAARERQVRGTDRDAFADVVQRFFRAHAIPHTRSWRESARLLGLRVVDHESGPPALEVKAGGIVARWAQRPVADIKKDDIRELLADSLARGATITCNRELAAIRKIFSWCVEGDLIGTNPALGIREPAKEMPRDRVLTDQELRLVWWAASAEGGSFGSILKLLILTAARRREVSHATWDEFDMASRMWTLGPGRTKGGRGHAIPLSDAALVVLGEITRVPGAVHLFGLGGRGGFSGYSKAKGRIGDRIAAMNDGKPIASWGLHDIRRSVATKMADIGVPPHIIEEILAHTTAKSRVAATYNRSRYLGEVKAALARWAEHVERLVDLDTDASNLVTLGPLR